MSKYIEPNLDLKINKDEQEEKLNMDNQKILKILKIRNNTLDFKKPKVNNNPIKLSFGSLGKVDNKTKYDNHLVVNLNKLPKIITRLSLNNFHITSNNINSPNDVNTNNNCKFSLFNKTLGKIGFRGITFNKNLLGFRKTNYFINNHNSSNENREIKFDLNLINSKTPNNNNLQLFKNEKKIKLEKHKEKPKIEGKRIIYEENNDSFINELNDLFSNVKDNNDIQEQLDEDDKNLDSDDDKEPDPRINFEQINRVNKSRPQTSYGGINARRKNLQNAFKNKITRPATSNVAEF